MHDFCSMEAYLFLKEFSEFLFMRELEILPILTPLPPKFQMLKYSPTLKKVKFCEFKKAKSDF